MAGETVFIVEDDRDICEFMRLYLHKEGFVTEAVGHGDGVLQWVKERQPDLIVLDVRIPGTDGFELCRKLRAFTEIPVLFVTCKEEVADKVLGLGVGGDDYMTKPFDPQEFLARVRALLRRAAVRPAGLSEEAPEPKEIICGDLLILPGTREVQVRGGAVALSATEFDLLLKLACHPNRIFEYEQLYTAVWGEEHWGDYRTVMVHMSNLRKKIEDDPAHPRYIVNIRGIGYKFQSGVPERRADSASSGLRLGNES
ncbi:MULTISPECIES: response regulator transcription factor [Paenibacillus]|uniref:response regulator transcription factor n=1 Tax=Paenibacillus TaxID=44249 RepID=UPI0022B92B62|nr:response regulator transcription factor [Paenibacillus caseinilyticus]MCZ8521757.1 response regulator transcription factor [Paenibacillus caseinilyticus]